MKKVKTKKRSNPNDSTFRNINALKKRMVRLEFLVEGLIRDVSKLFDKVRE